MNNGSNSWNVSYSVIQFCERILGGHRNTSNIKRHDDIIFELDRPKQDDHLKILCCNEYTMGLALVMRALSEIEDLDMIFIGGMWNGYSEDAKQYCVQQHIGLYGPVELNGALWKDDFWDFVKRDEEGNRECPFREA